MPKSKLDNPSNLKTTYTAAEEVTGNPQPRIILSDADPEIESLYDECSEIVNAPKRQQRMREMKEELGIYFNAQWTSNESADMEASGQEDIVLNVLRRATRTMIGRILQNSPTAKFLPRDVIPSDEIEEASKEELFQTIESLQGLWDHDWYISGGITVLRRAVTHQINCGQGWIGNYLDPTADYHRGEIKFRSRIPWKMVVPLNATNLDFSDAKRMFHRDKIDIKTAIEIVGKEYADILRSEATMTSINSNDYDHDTSMLGPGMNPVYASQIEESKDKGVNDSDLAVEWIESEEKIKRPAFLYKIITEANTLDTVVYIPEGDSKSDGEEEVIAELAENEVEYTDIKKIEIKVDRILRRITAGKSIEIEHEILPTSNFSNVPLIDEDTYNPLNYGEIFFVAPAQRLLNKVFSLGVLHLQTSGSGDRMIGAKGAFGDTASAVDIFQRNFNNPGSVNELAIENTQDFDVNKWIMRWQATPLQPAVVQTMQMLMQQINVMIGIDPTAYGNVSGGVPRTAQATDALLNRSDESARVPLQNLDFAFQRLGDSWLDRATAHYTFEKRFGVPDRNNQLKYYEINSLKGDGRIANAIEGVKANIFITSGASLMLSKHSMMLVFKELMPMSPVFVKMFLLYSDIPEKFDIMKEMDYTANLEQQMETLIPQLEELQKVNQSLNADVLSEKQKNILMRTQSTLAQIQTKYREKLKTDAAIRDANAKTQVNVTKNVEAS